MSPDHTAPSSVSGADTVTVLTSQSGWASKRIVVGPTGEPEIIGFNAGRWFRVTEYSVSDIGELSALLTALEKYPNCLVIRGVPRQGLDRGRAQLRRKTNFLSPPWGKRGLCIDMDKISLPSTLTLEQDQLGLILEHVIHRLPAEFHESSCHWQLSSSAGILNRSTVSIHLWFWLDRAVSDTDLKRWGKEWNAVSGQNVVDLRLFNDVQMHYTAAPVFQGVEDPFPIRSGLIRKAVGEVVLSLPREEKLMARLEPLQKRESGGGFEAILAQIGDHEGGGGFHDPIIRAVASYAAVNGVDGTDKEALFDVVSSRVLAADSSKHPDASYIRSMASRDHIIPAIDQALAKYGQPSARRKTRQLTGIKPYYPGKRLSAQAASAALEKTVSAFFEVR